MDGWVGRGGGGGRTHRDLHDVVEAVGVVGVVWCEDLVGEGLVEVCAGVGDHVDEAVDDVFGVTVCYACCCWTWCDCDGRGRCRCGSCRDSDGWKNCRRY